MKKKSLIIIMCILFLTACSFKKDENKENPGDSNQVVESNNNSNNVNNSNDSSNTAQNSNGSSNNSNDNNVKEVPYTLTSSEETISSTILEKVIPKTGSVDFDKLANSEKVKIVIGLATSAYYKSAKTNVIKHPEKVFTEEKLTNILHKYFGNNATMKFTDYLCDRCNKVICKYDKKKKAYVFDSSHQKHEFKQIYIYKQSKGIYKQGNIVKIKYKTMFSELTGKEFPKKFYKSYNSAKNKKNPIITNVNKYCKFYKGGKSVDCDFEKMFNENNFYTFVYKFEKNGNNFYYIGYEVEV